MDLSGIYSSVVILTITIRFLRLLGNWSFEILLQTKKMLSPDKYKHLRRKVSIICRLQIVLLSIRLLRATLGPSVANIDKDKTTKKM